MRSDLSIKVVGWSVSAVLVVTYLLAVLFCILAALLGPGSGMMTASATMAGVMEATLPGFGWHFVGFVIGLGLAVVYGFYIAVIFVPVYNYLQRRVARPAVASTPPVGEPGLAHR